MPDAFLRSDRIGLVVVPDVDEEVQGVAGPADLRGAPLTSSRDTAVVRAGAAGATLRLVGPVVHDHRYGDRLTDGHRLDGCRPAQPGGLRSRVGEPLIVFLPVAPALEPALGRGDDPYDVVRVAHLGVGGEESGD